MKLKAFTLIEILLTMILSGIVLSGVALSYLVIQRQSDHFGKHAKISFSLQQCATRLYLDCQKAERIYRTANGLRMETNEVSIDYDLGPDHIRRIQGLLQENWELSAQQIEAGFQKEAHPNTQGIIDYVQLQLIAGNDSFPIYISKDYSPASLLSIQAP